MRIIFGAALIAPQVLAGSFTLHENPVYYDLHPRVKTTFMKNGQDLGFSLQLDTGASSTRIMALKPGSFSQETHSYFDVEKDDPVTRAAFLLGEGYLVLRGLSNFKMARGTITYGTDSSSKVIRTVGSVSEKVRLFSGYDNVFDFDAEVYLTDSHSLGDGIGLLGARVDSELARSAGVFAYHPKYTKSGPRFLMAARMFGFEPQRNRKLFVGRPAVDAAIKVVTRQTGSEIFHTPNLQTDHWTLTGQIDGHQVTLIADTGSSGVFVPKAIEDSIKEKFAAMGATYAGTPVTNFSQRWQNCENYKSLPNIVFRLGEGQGFEIVITPDDYVHSMFDGKSCDLFVRSDTFGE